MITFNDCLSLAEIPEDLVEAISDHEHIPEIAAVELADHLLHSMSGEIKLCGMLQDEAIRAQRRHDAARAEMLNRMMLQVLRDHPITFSRNGG